MEIRWNISKSVKSIFFQNFEIVKIFKPLKLLNPMETRRKTSLKIRLIFREVKNLEIFEIQNFQNFDSPENSSRRWLFCLAPSLSLPDCSRSPWGMLIEFCAVGMNVRASTKMWKVSTEKLMVRLVENLEIVEIKNFQNCEIVNNLQTIWKLLNPMETRRKTSLKIRIFFERLKNLKYLKYCKISKFSKFWYPENSSRRCTFLSCSLSPKVAPRLLIETWKTHCGHANGETFVPQNSLKYLEICEIQNFQNFEIVKIFKPLKLLNPMETRRKTSLKIRLIFREVGDLEIFEIQNFQKFDSPENSSRRWLFCLAPSLSLPDCSRSPWGMLIEFCAAVWTFGRRSRREKSALRSSWWDLLKISKSLKSKIFKILRSWIIFKPSGNC